MPDNTQTQATRPARSGRGTRLALMLSLAVNLAVAGMLAGAVWRHGWHGDRDMGPLRSGMAFLRALPEQDRQALRDRMRRDGLGADSDRAARRAAEQQVLDALRAEPFDAQRLQDAVSALADGALSAQRAARSAWLERVLAMDGGTRRAYAADVQRLLDTSRNRHGHRD